MQLKYELEKNVSLVRFENGRIEISFNNNLDKSFVKDLSAKLLEWTKKRWIITFSKSLGDATIKEKKETKKKEIIGKAKKSDLYKTILSSFPDAELVDLNNSKQNDD